MNKTCFHNINAQHTTVYGVDRIFEIQKLSHNVQVVDSLSNKQSSENPKSNEFYQSTNDEWTLDASKKSNIQAHRVATELSRLEFYPDCNQQRILRIDFN